MPGRAKNRNLLAQASKKIAQLHDEAEAAIAREQAAAEEAVIDHATELSVEIAQRLLERLPHREVLRAFIDGTCREVRALAPEMRESLASADRRDTQSRS